jgi:hypothetical protein
MQNAATSEHKGLAQLAVVATAIGFSLTLRTRFRKYLKYPPALDQQESPADTKYVFWFYAISIGTFVTTCLTILLARQM